MSIPDGNQVSNFLKPPEESKNSGPDSRGRYLGAITRAVYAAAPAALTACQPIVFNSRGPIGLGDSTILVDSLAIMLAIVVPTIVAILGFACWYRASNKRARYLPDWAYSGTIELVVWAIPCMVVVLLGGVAWIGSHTLDPARPLDSKTPPLEIQVVSLDWKWLFIYPHQQIATVNRLVVPAGVPLHFSLTSASVMNAFFIPQLGSMIYTMSGMTTQLNLQADQPGVFHGLSSHYSGEGFSDMNFEVHAIPSAAFSAWIEQSRGSGPVLDEAGYAALLKQSINLPASTYRSVEPKLFGKIVTLHLPPGPGPQTSFPGATQTGHSAH